MSTRKITMNFQPMDVEVDIGDGPLVEAVNRLAAVVVEQGKRIAALEAKKPAARKRTTKAPA